LPDRLGTGPTEAERKAKLSGYALSKNVFIGKTEPFWKFSDKAAAPTLEETQKFFATGAPVAGDIGAVYLEAPSFHDAEKRTSGWQPTPPPSGRG